MRVAGADRDDREWGPPCGPTTRTGLWRSIVVLSPSCPWSLRPQQYTAPSRTKPQVWSPPPVTWMKCSPAPTSTGTESVSGGLSFTSLAVGANHVCGLTSGSRIGVSVPVLGRGHNP